MLHELNFRNGLFLAAGLLAFGVGTLPVRAAEEPAVRVLRDVTYYAGADADPVRHQLDLFLPRGRRDFPVVVFVHGGAWMLGDKTFFGRGDGIATAFAQQGIGAVLPNYRLVPAVAPAEQARDLARALAWTVKNIRRYAGSPERIFLCGHSAGGHLVSLLATDPSYLKSEGLDAARIIKGVVSVSGIYGLPEGVPGAGLVRLLGGKEKSFAALLQASAAASPLTHVRPGLPPFLLVYAEQDLPFLAGMAEEFAGALRKAHCEAKTLQVAERDHESVMFEARSSVDPLVRAMLTFITAHCRPAPSARSGS